MKKQSRKSKKLLWVLLSTAAAVVVLAAVAVGIFLGSSKPTEPYQSELYWNVERARYVSQGYYGVSSRIPDSDGYYHVNMAVNGEQMEVLVEDVNLINRMDFEEVMGLTFDENGIVNGILYLDEFTGGIAADKYTVVSVDGNTVVCNTSTKYKGLELTYQLSDDTGIWQIGDFEPMIGLPTVISEGDQVLMIRDYEGNITDVYVFPFVPPGDVYWNITRMWDSGGQCTTRERDSLGYFVYEFAVNGEIKTLRTKDQDVANLIDKHASQNMGFVFDENGDIIEVLNAGNVVCGGGLLADRYNVTELQDDEVTLSKNGVTLTATISKNCKFFDVSGTGEYVGVPVDGIQHGDKVVCLKDRRDQICVVFITNRLTTDDIYWVVERNEVWNRTTWTTDRKPAADGWYYIKLAANGKQITVKSKDAELVNELDSYVCWCVKLDGDEIVSIQDATNRYGGSLFGAFNDVVSIDGDKLTIQKTSNTATAIMAEDCVIYNVSTSAITVGEPTTVRSGDTIYGFTDIDGFVRYIFVTSTTYDGEIYWNVTRMYDSDKKVTTRQRAADGYYYFEMVCNGKVVWLKTADKEIATKVDMVVTRARGLKVSGDVILDVLAPEKLTRYPGVKPDVSWKPVTKVSGNQITVDDKGKSVSFKLASGCKIYDVSTAYEKHLGETTAIREGDYIVTLVNEYDQAVIVYVCGGRRKVFHTNQENCPCGASVPWQKWDGTGRLTSGYYYLTKDVTAPAGGWILDGEKVYLRLDGHSITADGRAFTVKSGSTLSICDHNTSGALIGSGTVNESGGLIQVAGSTAIVSLYNVDVNAEKLTSENGGAFSVSGWLSLYNVKVYGGTAEKKGGNIAVMPTGNFRMFGGSVTGGTAAVDGTNIYIAGNAYFEDTAIQGGVSAAAADKIFMISGGTVADGDYGIKLLSGQLSLSDNANIFGNKGQNLLLSAGATLSVKELGTSAKVGVSMAQPGLFASNAGSAYENVIVSDDADLIIKHDASAKTLTLLCSHSHCLCSGSIAGHACEDTGFTSLKQEMFTNATATSAPVSFSGSAYTLAAGNYYLTEDITLAAQILVTGEVKLCLNGKTLAASSSRVFAVSGGNLTITDCSDSGTLQGGESNIAATILIQGSSGNANGRLGTVNVYAGTIVGGKTNNAASGQGANIYIIGGTLNVYGGTLVGGQAAGQGGNVIVGANQTLNLYGGQLTSGTASKGDCLYVVKGANVTLDGAAGIEEIYMSGATLNVISLPEDFSTKLISSNMGVFAENVLQDLSDRFVASDDIAVSYSAEDKTLSLKPSHLHCICSGLDGHECAELGWIGLTQDDIINGNYTADSNSYYYLKEDVQLTKAITIGSEKTFNLCLNDKTITAADGVRAFVINGGTVNITDCGKTGNIKGTKAGVGATVLVQGSGGGANGKYLGTLNIYGGTVTGGESTASGGNIAVIGGTMNLYDGRLVGGTAKINGGTVYVEKGQKLNLCGGELISGTAAMGECLYADSETVITLDGVQRLDAVYLNGTQLVVASVPETFTTVISAAASGVLVQDLEEAVAAQFTTLPEDTLTYDPAAKTLSLTLAARYEHGHCLCDGFEGHSCGIVSWTGLTEADILTGNYTPSVDQYYYLKEDVQLTSAIVLSGNDKVLNLCLNDFSITAAVANRAFVINGGVLNITDCKENGTVIGSDYSGKNGGIAYIQGPGGSSGVGGQLNLYGGMLQGGKAANGCVAYVAWGTMNVYGGIIRGGTASNAAAAVWVHNGQSMNIFGGQLHSGTGAKKGSCVLALPDAVVTVGGNAQVDEIYLNQTGMLLRISSQYPLKETARIGVQMLTPGVFAEDVESYLEGTFICRNNDKVIYWDPEGGKLSVADPVSTADADDAE